MDPSQSKQVLRQSKQLQPIKPDTLKIKVLQLTQQFKFGVIKKLPKIDIKKIK